MKRIFCDSNCEPEPSIPWTNSTGFWPKPALALAGCAEISRSAAHASTAVRTRDKYTTPAVYQIPPRGVAVPANVRRMSGAPSVRPRGRPAAATREQVLERAVHHYLRGRRVDVQAIAAELGIGRTT